MRKTILIFSIFLFMVNVNLSAGSLAVQYKQQYSYLNGYNPVGKIIFKVKENNEYTFKVQLKDLQYAFMCKGEHLFRFQIIEPSGNELEGYVSYDGKLIVFENIMDSGVYTIKIYSPTKNEIVMEWGNY